MTLNEVVEAIDRIIVDSLGKIPENNCQLQLEEIKMDTGKEEE